MTMERERVFEFRFAEGERMLKGDYRIAELSEMVRLYMSIGAYEELESIIEPQEEE